MKTNSNEQLLFFFVFSDSSQKYRPENSILNPFTQDEARIQYCSVLVVMQKVT